MTTAVNATLAGNRPLFTLTPLGALVGNLGAGAKNLFAGVANPDAVIEALFANSEQGAWYDPSDLSTMFQDSAGTTPVTADGQPVGLILDKSGRNNHASQATAAKRPLYKTSGGLHWLQFDGVDDALATGNIDWSITNQVSMFGGVQDIGKAGWRTAYGAISSGVVSGTFLLQMPNNGVNLSAIGYPTSAGSLNQATAARPDARIVTSQLFDYSVAANQIKLRVDATQVAAASGSVQAAGFGNYPISMSVATAEGFNGSIYSLIVLGRTATTQEITDTEQWAADKTGVVL